MAEAFIGIGANLGARAETLVSATSILSNSVHMVGASHIYETEPIGIENQPAYLNGVLKIETEMGARDLLDHLLAMEKHFGRVREEKWGPRILDLDILLYGEEVIEEKGLCVPHPRLHLRSFVLAPLCDIAPKSLHPTLARTYLDLLESIGTAQDYTIVEGLEFLDDSK